MKTLLRKLRQNKIPENRMANVIAEFGENRFLEAKRDIEKHLNSEDFLVRHNSLIALVYDWNSKEHVKTCKEFILKDPDEDNRAAAALGLGILLEGTKNKSALKSLLHVFNDSKEVWVVRDSAYHGITKILGIKQPSISKLDYEKDIDWKLIKSLGKELNVEC